jgi:hypothetical protein
MLGFGPIFTRRDNHAAANPARGRVHGNDTCHLRSGATNRRRGSAQPHQSRPPASPSLTAAATAPYAVAIRSLEQYENHWMMSPVGFLWAARHWCINSLQLWAPPRPRPGVRRRVSRCRRGRPYSARYHSRLGLKRKKLRIQNSSLACGNAQSHLFILTRTGIADHRVVETQRQA